MIMYYPIPFNKLTTNETYILLPKYGEELKGMKKVKEYYFRDETIKTILYEFDTEEEMNASRMLNDPKRQTCFISDGKYYVGLHEEV